MSQLNQLLNDDKKQPAITDLADFADRAIASQSGISGMAVKATVGAAKKVDGEIIPKGIRRVFPELVKVLNPYWEDFENGNEENFGAFLNSRSDEVSDSLLAMADEQVKKADNSAVNKAYSSLRGKASKILKPQIPELGEILQKHMS